MLAQKLPTLAHDKWMRRKKSLQVGFGGVPVLLRKWVNSMGLGQQETPPHGQKRKPDEVGEAETAL